MQKAKKVVDFLNPLKATKLNWLVIAVYVGTAGVLLLWKFGVIDEELYHILVAFLQNLPFKN